MSNNTKLENKLESNNPKCGNDVDQQEFLDTLTGVYDGMEIGTLTFETIQHYLVN